MRKIVFALLLFVASDCLACTTAIVSAGASATGRPLMWKQRDTSNPYNAVDYFRGEVYGFTAVHKISDPSGSRVYSGMNEAGFAIMNNVSYNMPDKGNSDNGRIMAIALGKCRTVDDFENLLKTQGNTMKIASNIGVIDAFGGAAYFEVGYGVYKRFDVPENGWLVRANYSLSGSEDKGSGYARQRTAEHIMSSHSGKFTVGDLVDGLGRSYYNDVLGADMSVSSPNGIIYDEDFIPRFTTVCNSCVEGVEPGGRADASVMWVAPGYAPCCYATPVWMAAKDEIAAHLSSAGKRECSANVLADKLKLKAHSAGKRDGVKKYVDFRVLIPIMEDVRKAEGIEFSEGMALDAGLRSSFDVSKVTRYNAEALKRFESFKNKYEK